MRVRAVLLSMLVLLALALAVPVQAEKDERVRVGGKGPSAMRRIKCDPDASPNGPLICETKHLAVLDERLQRLRLRSAGPEQELPVPDPAWEAVRDACTDVACLRQAYRDALQTQRMQGLQANQGRFVDFRTRLDEDDGVDAEPFGVVSSAARAAGPVSPPPSPPAPRLLVAPSSAPGMDVGTARPARQELPAIVMPVLPPADAAGRLLPIGVLLLAALTGVLVWWRTRSRAG